MKHRFIKRDRMQAPDLDITSLLDVLVILLVFLLKSYNASDLTVDIVKKLELASSSVREMTSYAPVIQMNSDKEVYFNGKMIGRMPAGGKDFAELRKLLLEEKKILEESKSSKKAGLVNIILDKDINYGIVRELMHQCAVAGYGQFKFLVRGNY